MKKRNRPLFGIFAKLAIAFVIIGLFPLLLISHSFFQKFSENIRNILLNDANLVLTSASGYVDTMLEEWDEKIAELYYTKVEETIQLNDILSNSTMSQQDKNYYIRKFLSEFNMGNGLKSIRLLDKDGNLYYTIETVGKVINIDKMEEWRKSELANHSVQDHKIMLTAIHTDDYFSNINDEVITIERNLFDITSVKTVENCLATIYLDISKDVIEQQLADIGMGSRSGFYIIDKNGLEIYRSQNQTTMTQDTAQMLLKKETTELNFKEDASSYYLVRQNANEGWINVMRIHKDDILENVKRTEQYILIILAVSSIVLIVLYLMFSVHITVPIRKLERGMKRIQEGNLDTRVEVESRDEVGILAEGFNQMASQLQEYIDRVYGAEIKQRDAELNALKSQIKPHYLYNTLDIIRMTAINNEDRQAAQMIESLARQLRYLLGHENEVVNLARELDNISDYFNLISIRYEQQMRLTISVPERLQKVPILKLVLQPVVENAIKHGLKPKGGKGTIWISARTSGKQLEITVMDDGVGMSEDTQKKLQEKLNSLKMENWKPEQNGGMGLCNVKERIEKNYGKEYGLEVTSTLGTGTIVMLRIPYQEEGNDNVEGDFN